MKLKLEFSGGLELLFSNVKEVQVEVPTTDAKALTVSDVIFWARDNLLTERPELFVKDTSVRPGILVLVNDVDWELTGELGTELEENDTIVFISTLHGG